MTCLRMEKKQEKENTDLKSKLNEEMRINSLEADKLYNQVLQIILKR